MQRHPQGRAVHMMTKLAMSMPAIVSGGVRTVTLPEGNQPNTESLEASIRAYLTLALTAKASYLMKVVLEPKTSKRAIV